MEKTGFYCKKCNSIPLIQIVPKEKDIEIFCMCKCNKKLLKYDTFMKNYYKTNFDYSKISDKNIFKEYIEKDPLYSSINDKKEINLEKLNTDFNFVIEKISDYNLELKTKIIWLLNNKISEIEKIYKQNEINNIKLQNIIRTLISNYKSNKKNSSNLKNLQYNTNFNFGYKNETYNKLNFDKNFLNLESLVNNVSNYLRSNFILSSYNEQIHTIKTFYNHSKEVTSIIEVKPEILAASSLDNYIILLNLEKKKSIYKFIAHNNGVNKLLKINQNMISCGGDNKIKIWPKIDDKNLDLVNCERNYSLNTEELSIAPINSYDFKEPILNIIKIDNDYLLGHSCKNIYLIKYDIIEDNCFDTNNENKKLLDIKFNIEGTSSLDNIKDVIKIKNKNLIVVYSSFKLTLLSYPQLKIISEIKVDNDHKNSLIELDENEILFAGRNSLNIININKFKIKLKVEHYDKINYLFKLKDDTILIGTKNGIKRMNIKYSEDISLINKIYNITTGYYQINIPPPEIYTYLYEFLDGRLAICSSYGNIKICKFKLS